MKELDTVQLIKAFEDLSIGTVGVIVHKYDGRCFEVEFFDRNDDTIGVYTTPADYVRLAHTREPRS